MTFHNVSVSLRTRMEPSVHAGFALLEVSRGFLTAQIGGVTFGGTDSGRFHAQKTHRRPDGCGAVLTYSVQTGRRTDNPIRDKQGAFQAPTREHFASIGPGKGLPEFLKALEAYAGHPNTLGIIRMILWTGSRTGEVRGASPDGLDLDAAVWRIPAERMKKRRVHVVPLPKPAIPVLRELMKLNAESRYMFPSPMNQSMASGPPFRPGWRKWASAHPRGWHCRWRLQLTHGMES